MPRADLYKKYQISLKLLTEDSTLESAEERQSSSWAAVHSVYCPLWTQIYRAYGPWAQLYSVYSPVWTQGYRVYGSPWFSLQL